MSRRKSPTTRSSPDGDGHDQAHGHHVDRCGHRAGRVLRLPELQGAHHQPGDGLDGQSAADRLHHDGRLAGLAAAGASRRQPARGEWRRSVAGARGYRRSDQFQFRRRRACRGGAAAAAFRGRRGQVAGVAGDRGSRADRLRSRCETVEGAGDQPGDRRQRHVQPEERACPGRAAEGDRGQEDAACAVRRSSGDPRGGPRPVS